MGITLEGQLYLAPIDPNLQHALDFATGEKCSIPFPLKTS